MTVEELERKVEEFERKKQEAELVYEFEINKAALKKTIKMIGITNTDIGDLIDELNKIREGGSESSLREVVDELVNDVDSLEYLMKAKSNYEKKLDGLGIRESTKRSFENQIEVES